MNQKSPLRVQEDKSTLQRMLEIAAIFGIVFLFFVVFWYWAKLPDSIPSHYNAAGEPDDWSGKGTLIILPLISLFLYFGLSTLARFPHHYNFPWKITEENQERQFYLAQMLVLGLKTEIIWLFGYIEWQTVQTGLGKTDGLGNSFIFIFLGIIFGTIGNYFVKAFNAK
jgi:hypothetical protein